MSSVALIFVLCFASLHAFHARLLSASNDNQNARKPYQLVLEEVEKLKELSDETSNPSSMKADISMATVQLEATNINERKSHHEDLGTNSMKPKLLKFIPHIEKSDQPSDIRATSGNGITKSFSHNDQFRKTTQTEGQKDERRSMLGSIINPQADTDEEAVDTNKESDTLLDDIDMMDYAQPHRKPPIHNEKP